MLQFSRSSCLIWDPEEEREETLLIWDPPNKEKFISQWIWSGHTAQPSTFVSNHHEHSNKHTPKGSAMCVQKFDDSQSSAIRITYRISLRSSSFQKPRYPSPIVVSIYKNNSNFLITFKEITQKRLLPFLNINKNDPSAGSPTETLLRLHLPLNGKIYTTSLLTHSL